MHLFFPCFAKHKSLQRPALTTSSTWEAHVPSSTWVNHLQRHLARHLISRDYLCLLCTHRPGTTAGPHTKPLICDSTWTHPRIGWWLWDFSPLLSFFHKMLLSVLWHVWFLPASVFSRGRMDRQWIPGYFYVGDWYKYEYASISCFCEVVLHTCFQTDVVFLCMVWIS